MTQNKASLVIPLECQQQPDRDVRHWRRCSLPAGNGVFAGNLLYINGKPVNQRSCLAHYNDLALDCR